MRVGVVLSLKPIFQFGNVVVVDDGMIGVICKTWTYDQTDSFTYDVYVRSYNGIKEYIEKDVNHFIYSKELSDEEMDFY